MSTLASDTFDGTGALSANWTVDSTGSNPARASGVCNIPASVLCHARYTGTSFPDDQWAQITLTSVDSTSDSGAWTVVRMTNVNNLYLLQGNAVETRLYRCVAGTYVQMGSDGPACSAGDVLYLEVRGTTLTAKRNGTTICGTPLTNSALASGNAGFGAGSASGSTIDNWSAGDFALAPQVITDTLNVSESISAILSARVQVKASDDLLVLSEDRTTLVLRIRAIIESLVITDEEALRTYDRNVIADDDIALTDEMVLPGSTTTLTVDETGLLLTDATLKGMIRGRVVSEALQPLQDAVLDFLRRARSADDAVSVSDQSFLQYVRGRLTEDDVAPISDAIAASVQGSGTTYTKLINDEIVTVADIIAGTIVGSGTIYDTLVSDGLVLNEAMSAGITRGRDSIDAFALSDAFTSQIFGSSIASTIDAIEVSEDLIRVMSRTVVLDDGALLQDSIVSSVAYAVAYLVRPALGVAKDQIIVLGAEDQA